MVDHKSVIADNSVDTVFRVYVGSMGSSCSTGLWKVHADWPSWTLPSPYYQPKKVKNDYRIKLVTTFSVHFTFFRAMSVSLVRFIIFLHVIELFYYSLLIIL